MFAAVMLMAFQQVAATPGPTQRVSERLYYLHPVSSCVRSIAREQTRLFNQRFAKRIANLTRKDTLLNGEDVGFDVIAIGHCSKRTYDFDAALRKFDAQLKSMELEFDHVR